MVWPGSSGSRYSPFAGFCELCDEPPDAIKTSEILGSSLVMLVGV